MHAPASSSLRLGGCFEMNSDAHGLREPVQHIRSQRARAFKEVAQQRRVDSGLCGNFLQGPSAVMDSPSQMAAERVLCRCLLKPFTAFKKLRQFGGDFLAVAS